MSVTFAQVEELAATIVGGGLTVENDTVVLGKDVYYANLPEGISQEQADAVHAYDATFLAATGLAAGQTAVEYFANNSDCAHVSVVAPLDHMEVSHRVYAEYQIDEDVHHNYVVSSSQLHTRGLQEDIIGRMQETVANLTVAGTEESEAA